MKGYGQFCPVAKAAEVFCVRWTPLILRDLALGASRFSELQRGVPLASPTLLSRRLKELEAEGIVERRLAPGERSWTYHLTPAGREFVPLVEALGVWGQRWTRRQLAEGEISLELLIWALERGADPGAFGAGRTTVRLELTDQPAHKRYWWFVNDDGGLEMCVSDPGHEVDLYLAVTLPDIVHIWQGDIGLGDAIDSGRLQVDGLPRAMRALPGWLAVSTLAHVKPARAA